MATPQEIRRIRLKNDYKEMCNIKGDMIQWEIISGIAPYVEEYKLTVKVRSIVNQTPTYRNEHILNVIIPSTYPKNAPKITMITKPIVFHANWYAGGDWCYGTWDMSESLAQNILRMVRTLQFDKEITNPNSAANSAAGQWYSSQINAGIFPCDTQELPDPTKAKLTIDVSKPKFEINNSKLGFKIEDDKLQTTIEEPKKRFNIN